MCPAYNTREDQLLWQYDVSVHVGWNKTASIVQTLLDGCSMIPGLGMQGQLHQLAAKEATCCKPLKGIANG